MRLPGGLFMTLQPLTDAQISLLLAKEALDNPKATAVAPTPELRSSVDAAFEAAEKVLEGCPFSCSGQDRFHGKELVFHPGRGLLVADRNGSDAIPWRRTPEPVLAQCLPLLRLLRQHYDELLPKHQTRVLANISQATVEMAVAEPKAAEVVAEEEATAPAAVITTDEDPGVAEIPEVLTLDDALMKASKTQTSGRASVPKKTTRGFAKSSRR